MRIVLSGGWGYRNLGDDAILDATIQVLQARYPGCEVDVLTYDPDDSAEHAAERVRLRFSAHRLLDLNAAEHYCPHVDADYSRLKQQWIKARFRLAESAAWYGVAKFFKDFSSVENLIKGADLFVMGGGGYFNELWRCKVRAHLLELEFAAKHDVPVYILGPTLGRFSGVLKAAVGHALATARKVTVRDETSHAVACEHAPEVDVVPDIALASWLEDFETPLGCPVLGVVFTNPHQALQAALVAGVSRFICDNPDWRVKIFISRKWRGDFRSAAALQRKLHAAGVGADIVYPAGFKSLETGLAACSLVVSENLHGMIIAARNRVPVISVNDYRAGSPNSNKILSFMRQINSENCFVNSDSSASDVLSLLCESTARRGDMAKFLGEFRSEVRAAYGKIV